MTQTNAENSTAAVLLLDGLNTLRKIRLREQQMLKFLARQYDPNTKLAVIALTNKLTVLQDFTQDPLLFASDVEPLPWRKRQQWRAAAARWKPRQLLFPRQLSICRRRPQAGRPAAADPRASRHACGRRKQRQHFEDIAYMMDVLSGKRKTSRAIPAFRPLFRLWSKLPASPPRRMDAKCCCGFSTGFPFSVVGDSPSSMETERNYGDQIRRTVQSAERCACGHVHH